MKRISVIGLGKLGLCTAACFASRGHMVIGVDSNREHIQALRNGQCPIAEKDLADLLRGCGDLLEFSMDYEHAIKGSDITLIIVPTPSDLDGRFSNACIDNVLDWIAPALASKKTFHVVGVVSTVMPTTCEKRFRPRLEHLTGKTCGREFGLVYNPEFIALGSVIHDFLHPDLVLIGASDDRSAQIVKELYASMVESSPDYALMSLTNAEITKLSLNCFVTMKISFVNELSAICEQVPGTDVDKIAAAMGADTRIGRRCLSGGMGFGGPCFPRDNRAFQAFARDAGRRALLSPQVVSINRDVVDRLYGMVTGFAPSGSPVALLGLSYKSGTAIVEQSQSIALAHRLLEVGFEVRMHDPQALESARSELGGRGRYFSDPYEAAAGASVVVLLTAWPHYRGLDICRLEEISGPTPLLIDCWRTWKNARFRRFKYRGLGLGGDDVHELVACSRKAA